MPSLNHNSKPNRKSKRETSELAKNSFEAFRPFINIFDCGGLYDDHPYHFITRQDWALYRRHKAGERGLTYPDGFAFNPYLAIVKNIYSRQHVHDHLVSGGRPTYYTSGRKGLALLYLDIDAQHPWQTDEYEAKAILQNFFPAAFFPASKRGQNGYVKVRYRSIKDFNATAGRLQQVLKRLFLHLGILCDIEVKGTITCDGKSGSLAKLPFTNGYPCYWRDQTDCWGYKQLEAFKGCPVVNVNRIKVVAEQVNGQLEEAKIRQFAEYKKSLAEPAEEPEPQPDAPVATPVSTSAAPPPPATGQERAVRPVRADFIGPLNLQENVDGGAFARNHKDIKPFVRAFYRQARRFPTTDETLDWLHEHGRFSGEWEDNQARRARRVGQILRFTERTFDPDKLCNGESRAVSLSVDRFNWWVRQHFGDGIAVQRTDHSRFDPETMTAPVSDLWISAQFIQTFLAVAEFCLRHDPLGNKAVPTNRIKKLWAMVEGGANWNQRHYQIVRDRLDRMGVITITDREHEPGKAWRWESGQDFPEGTWKEQQRKQKERVRHLVGDAIELNRERNEHNTLYQDGPVSSPIQATIPLVRTPP
jgi:hypothetical protein